MKAVNIWGYFLYQEILLKTFLKINISTFFYTLAHARKKFFLDQLKYLFLIKKFPRKRKWVRYRREEQFRLKGQ